MDLPNMNSDKVKKMEEKIADQNKEINKLAEENAQLKEKLSKMSNQQQNNCPSNLTDAFESGVTINKNSDVSDEEWDSCRESVGNKIVQDCAKQAIRQYNAEKVDQPNYFFIIKVLSSHSAFCIGYMHYVEILIGKSSISKKQATQQEFEEMLSSKNLLENEDKVEKTIMAICCDCDEREIAQDHPARTIQISEI